MLLYFVMFFIISQRLGELYLAKKNAKYIKSIGGYEVAHEHYILIVILHIAFLLSILMESSVKSLSSFWLLPFIIFILAQITRIWIISSLGPFWNTRIFVLPHSNPVKKGPYQFLRHPNYVVVMIEMITLPLIFKLYITAIVFPILNALVLAIRIKEEEKALNEATSYQQEMKSTNRFFPHRFK